MLDGSVRRRIDPQTGRSEPVPPGPVGREFAGIARLIPHLSIGWANLQWPPTLTHTITIDTKGFGKVFTPMIGSEPSCLRCS